MAAAIPEAAPAPRADSPAEAASPPVAPAPATAGAVNQEALEWARQAYARLKAEQQAQKQAASPTVETPPATPSEASSPPESESLQPLATAEPIVAAAATAAVPAPEAPQAPVALTPLPLKAPAPAQAPAAPGRSLLEQAAAQRQQRLQELTAQDTAGGSEALSPPGALPGGALSGAAAPVTAGDDLQLGAFDDTFTWSAEVLAAQGRSLDQVSLEEIDWLGRLRRGLEKTRRGFVTQLLDSLGDDPLTPEVIDDLETTLLRADVGVQATDQVLAALRQRLNEEVVDPAEGLRFLKEQLRGLLEAPITASGRDLLVPERGRLNVWLLVGVNGVGKTTTLGKLANLAVRSGYTCLIAAADTFRAAAVQQVSVWGERSGVPVISNPSANADPAAVVYDAIGAAQAKGSELVLVDTAGRLQTKNNLMEELAKVRRIVDKLAPDATVESLLVLDASQGQNGLKQALAFAQAAGLTGVVITKLDGSARGGVALAVASEAKLPIRFIGAGETILDLRPFNSFEFVEALLAS
ncbi:MAG: signal recognition particle-docking protein FtsY [Cyanobacteria bacterium]|nr:signal recognition particle-docking protein FtsY [Cyanobacteriota bacterium]